MAVRPRSPRVERVCVDRPVTAVDNPSIGAPPLQIGEKGTLFVIDELRVARAAFAAARLAAEYRNQVAPTELLHVGAFE